MIFTERTITIRNDSASINIPVILYRGDKNVEVRFTLVESPYKYSNRDSVNIIESTDAAYAQLIIKTPNDRDPIFGDITAVGQSNIIFVIEYDMIDEIGEVGEYDFQIRLFDSDQTSMVTLPEVVSGFIIKEPIAKENATNNITNSAIVDSAVVTNDTGIPTFVSGSYNKTTWSDGDVISKQKLNKMEDGIYETYELSKDNSSQIKEKANKNDVIKKGYGTLNDFDETTRAIIQGLQSGQINAVLGGQNVTKDNIKVEDIQSYNIKGCNPVNVFDREKATYGKYLNPEGHIGTNSHFCYSDYIPCQTGDTFEIIGCNGKNNVGNICGGVIYDSSKDVIGSFTTYKPDWVTTHGSSSWNNKYEVTDSNACFVRLNVLASSIDNTKMITKNYPYRNEDGSIIPYIEYGKTKIEWLDLDDIKEGLQKVNDDIENIITVCETSFGKTYEELPTNITPKYYGFANRIKAPKDPISKIVLYTGAMTTEADYHCIISDDTRKIIYGSTTARSTKSDGTGEYITFNFDNVEVKGENIYISVTSNDENLKVTYSNYKNDAICTATEDNQNYYVPKPTTSIPWYSPSPKTGYYMLFEVFCNAKSVRIADKSIGLEKLSDEVKQYIKTSTEEKKDLDLFIPNKVFTWGDGIKGDFIGNRVPKVGVYLDHMIPYGTSDLDIYFENVSQKNRLEFITPYPIDWNAAKVNNSLKMQTILHNFKIKGHNYNEVSSAITQVSVRNDVGADTHVALLTIGDSTVEGANALITKEDGTQIWSPFWHETAKQFAMDSIEANDENKYKFTALGVRKGKGGNDTITYLEKTREIITATNGESGSKLADHLRYISQKRPSQETWDILGLGDGTGSDYRGTSAQKDLIAQTNENYSGTEEDYNGNAFFDNSKTGDNKFSISKWLERYRTLDDNGNRLTLGNGTGTKITNDNINTINVCTPTHVLLQTGLNDWSQVSVEQYLRDMDIFVREIKSQLPNAKIAITLFPDDPGTYFRELYPNIKDCDMRYLHGKTRDHIAALFEHFKDSTDVELLPFYFVMPPAVSLSYRWVQNDDGTKVKAPFGPASNDYHANGYAHKAWAHQLYAWIKSTLV